MQNKLLDGSCLRESINFFMNIILILEAISILTYKKNQVKKELWRCKSYIMSIRIKTHLKRACK